MVMTLLHTTQTTQSLLMGLRMDVVLMNAGVTWQLLPDPAMADLHPLTSRKASHDPEGSHSPEASHNLEASHTSFEVSNTSITAN